MITGTIMFDVDITADNEDQLNEIELAVKAAIKAVAKVERVEQVDSDLSGGDEDEGPADPQD